MLTFSCRSLSFHLAKENAAACNPNASPLGANRTTPFGLNAIRDHNASIAGPAIPAGVCPEEPRLNRAGRLARLLIL